MRRPLLAGLVGIVALAASSAAARPPGPLTGYAGSAWFNAGQGIVVLGATYAECQQNLQNGINYRVQNWGWSVTSITPCRLRSGGVGPVRDIAIAAEEAKLSLSEAVTHLERDGELRARFQIDAYEKELEAAFPEPNVCEAQAK